MELRCNSTEQTDRPVAPSWQFVTLVSSEGATFILDRSVAIKSEVLATMLKEKGFAEGSGNINFPTIGTESLEKLVSYLYYKYCYSHSTGSVPEFSIPDGLVLDMLLVANYLNE